MNRTLFRRRQFLAGSAASAALAPSLGSSSWVGAVRRLGLPAGRASLRILIPEGCEANLRPVVEAFRAVHGVGVELERVSVDDVATVAMLRTLGGSADFDLALPATFWIPDLVEADVLRPLNGLLDLDPASESLYSLGDRYRGKTYGLQTDGDVYLMFYRRDWIEEDTQRRRFEDRFERPLEVARTWEDLDDAMEFFHRPAEGRYGGNLFRTPTYIAWEFWLRMHAKGVFPVDDEMNPLIDSDAAALAGEELVAASRWQSPGAPTHGLFDSWEEYASGQVFCHIGWGGSQKRFRRADSPIRDRLTHGPTPGGVLSGGLREVSYFNWGWNYTVAKGASDPELAARFALFATTGGPGLEAVRAADGFFDPFRSEHYDDDAVEAAYTRPFLKQHRASLEAAIPDFYLAGRMRYFDLLGRFLARANRGEMTVREALGLVARGWQAITDDAGRDGQIERWLDLKARYPDPLRGELRSTRE